MKLEAKEIEAVLVVLEYEVRSIVREALDLYGGRVGTALHTSDLGKQSGVQIRGPPP